MAAPQHPWLARWSELFVDNLTEYAVFAIDLAGTVLTWQPGVGQVLGYARESFVGRGADIIFTDSDRRAGAPEWEMKTALQLGQATDERWHVRADGGRFWGSGMMVALSGPGGKPVGFAKIVRDRTALRLRGERLGLRARQLEGDVATRTEQIRTLAADLTLAEQRERGRISQLLHDELQQQLYALQLTLDGAQAQAKGSGHDALYKTLTEAQDLLRQGLVTTRTLVSELSPAALRQGRFGEALVWLAQRMDTRYGLSVDVNGAERAPDLPEALAVLLFQCVQELLFNVVKHARVEEVTLTVQAFPESLWLAVEDAGQGFAVRVSGGETPRHDGFGLHSVEQRLSAFGGALRVISAPGNGTRVTIEVPLGELWARHPRFVLEKPARKNNRGSRAGFNCFYTARATLDVQPAKTAQPARTPHLEGRRSQSSR